MPKEFQLDELPGDYIESATGVLTVKLSEDLCSAVRRYVDQSTFAEIHEDMWLSGIVSVLTNLLCIIEKDAKIPRGVIETYLTTYREHHGRAGKADKPA